MSESKKTSVKNSKDKVRRFVRLFLGIEPPAHFFHQTLTFRTPIHDEKIAKARLKKLLERNLCQGVLYVRERQAKGGIHFHLLFYFYRELGLPFPSSKMRHSVADEVFRAWNELNGGVLRRQANVLREWNPCFATVDYLTKEARSSGTRTPSETNWWGVRNSKNLLMRGTTKKEVARWMAMLYPRVPKPLGLRFSKRKFLQMKKDFFESSVGDGVAEWDRFKQQEMGVTAMVSDSDYIEFRKSLGSYWRKTK